MQPLTFQVGLDSVEESNLFLRALWASIRLKFGRLGWQYAPHRDGPHRLVSFRTTSSVLMKSTFPLAYATLGFATYESEELRLESVESGLLEVALRIEGYDRRDLAFMYNLRVGPALDLLTCWTNCLVRRFPAANQTETRSLEPVRANTLWVEDEDWIDVECPACFVPVAKRELDKESIWDEGRSTSLSRW